jgi:hypothetical protein
MDPLTVIIAAMTAILFSWIGYFLGNAFPVTAKAKRTQAKRKTLRELEGRPNPIQEAVKKAIDWLLEREEEEVIAVPPTDPLFETKEKEITEIGGTAEQLETSPPSPSSRPAPQKVLIDSPEIAGEDAVVLWHNRRQKKLFAKLDNDMIDLDDDLSPAQHGALSMLLVDLQERVGIAATLKDAIVEGTDKVMAEKERKKQVPGEEPLEKPSFSPIKSIVNYVRSDIPKLEEHTLSIPEQIDEILQENIAGTYLEDKGISVREWPGRGVVFIVGIDIYNDIHQVPDPEIRTKIRQAVQQWEANQEDDL